MPHFDVDINDPVDETDPDPDSETRRMQWEDRSTVFVRVVRVGNPRTPNGSFLGVEAYSLLPEGQIRQDVESRRTASDLNSLVEDGLEESTADREVADIIAEHPTENSSVIWRVADPDTRDFPGTIATNRSIHGARFRRVDLRTIAGNRTRADRISQATNGG